MDLRLSSLVVYLASIAYLVGWLVRQLWALSLNGRAWWFRRQMAGRVLSLKTLSRSGNHIEILISLSGALFGCLMTSWLSQWMVKEWLLVSVVTLSILSEEFQTTKGETQLLAAMVLLDRIHALNHPDEGLFELLAKVAQELPAGEVQKAVRETILQRRSGIDAEKSMDALRGIDPLLDEFVLNLRLSGWENGPTLAIISIRLLQRAGRKWYDTSRTLLIKDQARPYVRFGRAALIAGLSFLLLSSPAGLIAAWPGHTLVVWLGLALLASGLLLYLSLTIKWLRRSLAVLIFLSVLVPFTNTIKVHQPAWIQVQTITHNPGSLSDSRDRSVSPMVVDQAQATFFLSTLFARLSPGSQNITLATTPTPTLSSTPTITLPVAALTISEMELTEPCCHRFHQPR